MIKIEKLLQELCPNGVEYVRLESICKIQTGKLNANAMVENGEYAFFTCDATPFKIDTYAFDAEAILVSGNGSQVGHVNYYKGKFNAYQRTYVLTEFRLVEVGFLLHYMNAYIRPYIMQLAKKGSVPYITLPMLQNFLVPVPPLEAQREIVQVLDKFTLLTAELTAELTARRQQYEYYRDNLLTFEAPKVQFSKLSEVSNIVRGVRVVRNDLTETGKYPVYQNSLKPLGYFDKYNRPANSAFVISAGAAGEIGFSTVDFWSADDCFCFEDLKGLNSKFLYYVLMSNQELLKSKVRKASIPRLSRLDVESLTIPVPSMEIQERIVRVLDNFDAICSDLQIGLPAEIEARQKQYEFYRDKLLTFNDSSAIILTDRQTDRQTGLIKLLQYVYGFVPVRLGDIAEIIRGGNFQKKDFCENGFPCIHYGQIYTKYGISAEKTLTFIPHDVAKKSKIASKNDIVMAVTSENVDDVCKCVAWLGDSDIAVSGHTAIIKHSQNAKYLAYYFHTYSFYKQKEKLAHGTKVMEVTPDKLNDVIIPLPSIEKQNRIVDLLDRFYKLCNDIEDGLPAEIEARQKQYEFYRDKLLTFAEKK